MRAKGGVIAVSMKGALDGLPPLGIIAAALLKTTEFLAHELAAPTDEPPQWRPFEWQIARAVAAMHGLSPLLHGALRWQGPEGWRGFLDEQREHAIGRDLQITRVLDAIDAQARRDDIAIVALKGAVLRAIGIYAPGTRPMGDIDLLIRRNDAQAVAKLLSACNYEPAFNIGRHQVFQPVARKPVRTRVGEHVDNPIKIEVHWRIAERLPVAAADITEHLWPSEARAGLNGYPAMVPLMMHLLLHAAGNMRARALRHIQLHDIALLAARFGPLDWEKLLAVRPEGRALWWAAAPLMLTARYYPAAFPQGVLEHFCLECPRRLRRRAHHQNLTEVSWSNIRIEAFPGVEWARTPLEALQFMSGRIWPSREARLELKQGADQIPNSTSVGWYNIPHSVRIVRWIFSSPPRVQTVLSVRAALTQPDEDGSNGGSVA